MTEASVSVKRRTPNVLHPKDWDRRARVIAALSERQMTFTELAAVLEVSPRLCLLRGLGTSSPSER